MFNLINMHAKKYRIGIHPSWQSGDNITWNKIEKERLQNLSGQIITASRQHYIRFNLPTGYRLLLQNGITDDHSMGYGSINGFRASVANTFNWFDLEHNETTELRIHPFCFMDANAYYEQKYTAAEAYAELIQYYSICKKVNGQLITVYHNNFLGTLKTMESWKLHYKKFVEEIEGGL